MYRVTQHVGPNLLLPPKQRLCFSTWASYWNGTFVLMSTGGWEQHEWSLCNLYNKQLTLLVNQSNRFDSPRLKFINLLSIRPTELILPFNPTSRRWGRTRGPTARTGASGASSSRGTAPRTLCSEKVGSVWCSIYEISRIVNGDSIPSNRLKFMSRNRICI